MKEGEPKETSGIISDLNANLNPSEIMVETIAKNIGISETILYEWVKTDSEFSAALERYETVQGEDPFKTGTVEDVWVDSMVIAFILMETRDRHCKPHNQYSKNASVDTIMGEILHQGDCLGVMRTLNAESVDCVITSPPYPGLTQCGAGYTRLRTSRKLTNSWTAFGMSVYFCFVQVVNCS